MYAGSHVGQKRVPGALAAGVTGICELPGRDAGNLKFS